MISFSLGKIQIVIYKYFKLAYWNNEKYALPGGLHVLRLGYVTIAW
jgi:hypothetical protein